jgi:uncharacterized protein (DUF433 family)
MTDAPRIVIDPEVCHGRPIIAGTRMRVIDILEMLAAGTSEDEILADFSYVTREDIRACLEYAVAAVGHRIVRAEA